MSKVLRSVVTPVYLGAAFLDDLVAQLSEVRSFRMVRGSITRAAVAAVATDHDAVLLPCREACRLLSSAGLDGVAGPFTAFTPWQGSLARWIDESLGRLPLGAQYLAFGTRVVHGDQLVADGPAGR